MIPTKRKCRICGAEMEYISYASKAADTMFIRYKCPECGAEAKEIAMLAMLHDSAKILEDLDKMEEKVRDLPWPET